MCSHETYHRSCGYRDGEGVYKKGLAWHDASGEGWWCNIYEQCGKQGWTLNGVFANGLGMRTPHKGV